MDGRHAHVGFHPAAPLSTVASVGQTAPGQQRAEPLCETNWSHDPRSRSVYFVVETGGILPRILGFPDFRQPEKKEKE